MTAQRFCVRDGKAADLARVLILEREVGEAPHWAESEYARILNTDGEVEGSVMRRIFVAEAEDGLLGFTVGKMFGSGAGGVAELESVAVDGAARRIGVGRALCEAVIFWCRSQRMTTLELEVRAGSNGAIALYSGLGFVVAGRRAGYYRQPVDDALLMRLDLAMDK